MTSIPIKLKTIADKYLPGSDDETDERNEADNSLDSSTASDSEKSPEVKSSHDASQSGGVAKQTFRGNAALLNLDDSDDDDEDDGPGLFGGRTGSKLKPSSAVNKVGIYGKKITQTKNHVKVIKSDFINAEKGLMTEIENETRLKVMDKENENGPGAKKFKDDGSSDEDDDSDDLFLSSKTTRSQKAPVEPKPTEVIERELSPPPPPQVVTSKPKRKSTSIAEKQLRELEAMKYTSRKQTADDSHNASTVSGNYEDLCEMVTVRVSTKAGIHKWDLNENDSFQTIFEKVAALENKDVDSILLTLNDRIIKFNDTPAGIKLKSYDIIDCVQNVRKPQERIRVVEQDQDIDELTNGNSNVLTLTLQTQEGRKSRVTFLVFKDEKFGNILKKYCEKRGLDSCEQYMIEFDGDKVPEDETPTGLDLDGGEIFDVKKSSKTTLQHVNENQQNYEFDDDVLLA